MCAMLKKTSPLPCGELPVWTIHDELQGPGAAASDAEQQEAFASHFVLKTGGAVKGARAAIATGFTLVSGELDKAYHSHREAQLLYVVRGELSCEAAGAWWIVPPNSALWVPGDMPHRVRARAPFEGYNVFLDPAAATPMPADCCAVSVTPLFREVMLRLAAHPWLYDLDGPAARLVAVLLDELAMVSIDKHRLPMPTDPRLRKLVSMMTSNPADGADMKTWGARIGVAERTLNRLLVKETGLSFGRWRQQLHIILAIQGMSRGASVQRMASDLGYENASSFVTMFRKALGKAPAKYMAERSMNLRDETAADIGQ